MKQVKATREGLVGGKTSSGWIIDTVRPFVALPSVKAVKLKKKVRVRNVRNGKEIVAEVLDVGPFNTNDDAYVFGEARPLAENGVSISGKGTNKAGIDLGEAVWHALDMKDNGPVEWEFV
jgi:hypothetical protein